METTVYKGESPTTALSVIADRLQHLISRMSTEWDALQGIADRSMGSQPQTATAKDLAVEPSSALDLIQQRLDNLEGCIYGVQCQRERLESLA